MKIKPLFVSIVFIGLIYSQSSESLYIPLEVGNRWLLSSYVIGDPNPYPSGMYTFVVNDTVDVNDTTYYQSNIFLNYNKFRLDQNGNLFMRFYGNDVQLINFDLPDGTIDTINFPAQFPGKILTITYETNKYIDSIFVAEFNDAIKISFKYENTITNYKRDLYQIYYFVKGIGIVAFCDLDYYGVPTDQYYDRYDFVLKEGIVNNKKITNIYKLNEIPNEFSLSQNYPNPFNPKTVIEFTIPESELVELLIFNSIGELVSKLMNENLNLGTYKVEFSGENLSSGIYYYQLRTRNKIFTKKMVLLK